MGEISSNIKIYKKTCNKVLMRVKIQDKTLYKAFLWRGEHKNMYILTLIGVAMLSSFITLTLLCCVIVGKESDKKWEEEEITKKEKTEE